TFSSGRCALGRRTAFTSGLLPVSENLMGPAAFVRLSDDRRLAGYVLVSARASALVDSGHVEYLCHLGLRDGRLLHIRLRLYADWIARCGCGLRHDLQHVRFYVRSSGAHGNDSLRRLAASDYLVA